VQASFEALVLVNEKLEFRTVLGLHSTCHWTVYMNFNYILRVYVYALCTCACIDMYIAFNYTFLAGICMLHLCLHFMYCIPEVYLHVMPVFQCATKC
jgi:hypothetical protein